MAVLFKAGDQVPVIPLIDVAGNADKAVPEQIEATGLKFGVTPGVTVMVSVAVAAHWPAAGVKVYVVVVVLFKAGAQVPVMPLVEVVGNCAKIVPAQTGAMAANVGVI